MTILSILVILSYIIQVLFFKFHIIQNYILWVYYNILD